MMRQARLVLLLLCSISGCAPAAVERRPKDAAKAASPTSVSARPSAAGSTARWALVPQQLSSAEEVDSVSQRMIQHGVRLFVHPDGALEQAEEVFPIQPVQALELPGRLGAGFVFSAAGSHTTWLWRADSWTGALRPLARFDPEASQIVAGFDRLYLLSKKTHQLRAISAATGQPWELGALPRAPSYGGLGFLDAWTAVVASDVRGLLVTFDAGASWHPLGMAAAESLDAQLTAAGLSFNTVVGRMLLEGNGTLHRADTQQPSRHGADAAHWFERTAADEAPTVRGAPPPRRSLLGDHPLRQAALSGVPAGRDTGLAAVWAGGVLALVDLADGTLRASSSSLPRAHAACHGIVLGSGFGFVCPEPESTTLYRYLGETRVERLRELPGRRQVLVAGRGALVIGGGCSQPEQRGDSARYCILDREGTALEFELPQPTGRERVVVLEDARPAVLLPPERARDGSLTLVRQGKREVRTLDLGAVEPALRRVLRNGLWLDGVQSVASSEGEVLRTWVENSGALVGVSVDLQGRVHASRPKENTDRSVVSGATALVLTSGDLGQLTTDFGFSWRDVRLPRGLSEQPRAKAPGWRGCGLIGCAFEEWVRLGFDADPPRAAEPEVPPVVVHSPKGISRWALSCLPTGRVAGQLAAARPSLSKARPDDALTPYSDNPWLWFFGKPPPHKPGSWLGFEYLLSQTSPDLQAYTMGPRAAAWEGNAQWLFRLVKRYSAGSVWSTRLARAAWKEVANAAELFGQDPATTARWQLEVDDGSERAVLMLRARGKQHLYLLEAERSPTVIGNADEVEIERLAGFAVVEGAWYFAAASAQQLVLHKVEGDRAVAVARYPQFARDGGVVTQLVGEEGGRGMALWARTSTSGWYVFPVHPVALEAVEPIHVPYEALRSIPPRCDSDAQGYEVVSSVPLTDTSPSRSNMGAEIEGRGELPIKGMSVKALVGPNGMCVRGVAAEVDSLDTNGLEHVVWPHPETPIQLTVTDTTNQVQADLLCRR